MTREEPEEIILIEFIFEHLEDCTNFFYNEYSKFVLISKKVDDKRMIKSTKKFLHAQFKQGLKCVENFLPKFSSIDECTEFYYNEYGKLYSFKKKLNDKKLYKYIRTFLRTNFKKARNNIKKQNKEILSKFNVNANKGLKFTSKPQIETKTSRLESSLNSLLELAIDKQIISENELKDSLNNLLEGGE